MTTENSNSNAQDDLYPDAADTQLTTHRDQVLDAVQSDGLALKKFPAFQNDEQVVLAAIKNNANSFQFADESLRQQKAFVEQAILANSQVFYCLEPALKIDRKLLFCAGIARKDNQQDLLEKFISYEADPYIKELDEKIFQKIKDQFNYYQALKTTKADAKAGLKVDLFEGLLISCNEKIMRCYLENEQNMGDTAVALLSEGCKDSIKQALTETLYNEVNNSELNESMTPVRDFLKKLLGVLLLIPTGGLPLLSTNYRTYFFATADKYQVYQLAQQVAHVSTTQADTNSIKSERDANPDIDTETSKLLPTW